MAMYKNKNTSYDMIIDKIKKTFHLSATGFFSAEDGQSFLNDYNRLVQTFPTSDYNLIIDAGELKPSSPEVAQHLGSVLMRYMEVPFTRRFLLTQGSAVTMSQFKRLGEQIPGWKESIEYVKDINEVHNLIK